MDSESDSPSSEPASDVRTPPAADRELQPRKVFKPRMPPAPAVLIRLKVDLGAGERVAGILGQFSLWWSLKSLAERVSDSPLFPRASGPALTGRSFLPLAGKPIGTPAGAPRSHAGPAQPWPAESRLEPAAPAALAAPSIRSGGENWLPGPLPLRAFARRSAAHAATPPLFPLPRFAGLFPEVACRHLAPAPPVPPGRTRGLDMRCSPARSFGVLGLPGEGIHYPGARLLREKGDLALGAFVTSGPRWAAPAQGELLRVMERERALSDCEYCTESMLRSHVPANGRQSRRDP